MSSESNQPENDFSVIEELTAYLDGELDQEQIRQVENRLGEDTAYLAEMQSLQKTWDLLDVLPSAEPGTSFTKTTMELVVGEAVKSKKSLKDRGWSWAGRIAIVLALPTLIFATAFGVIRKYQTEPDRILIEKLSVIENLPRYDSIECDIGFLVKLSEQSLFTDSNMFVDDGESLAKMIESEESMLIPQSDEDRRAYVGSLDVQKKLKLKRRLDDYLKMSSSQRERLDAFDDQLNQSENRVRLMSTLTEYFDWLMKIDSGERSDLRDLAADERVCAIMQIRNREALKEFGKDALEILPSKEDAKYILGWCESVFRLKERQIRDRFPSVYTAYTKVNKMRTPPEEFVRRKARHANLHSIVDFLIREDRPFMEQLILDNREISVLYDILSAKARALLEDRTEAQRRDLMLTWVESANQSQRGISLETLKRFEEQLSVKERDRLEKMSSEDYVEALKQMYIERRKSRGSLQSQWELELEEMLESGGN